MNLLSRWQMLFTRRYMLPHLLLGIVAASISTSPNLNVNKLLVPVSNNLFCLIYHQAKTFDSILRRKSCQSHSLQQFYLSQQKIFRCTQIESIFYDVVGLLFMICYSIIFWLTNLLGTRSTPHKISHYIV